MKRIVATLTCLFLASNLFAQEDSPRLRGEEMLRIITLGDTERLIKEVIKEFNIDINRYDPDEYIMPLLYNVCSEGDTAMVGYLLRNGASPNVITTYGLPAHWAADKGHLGVIHLLLDYGFDPRTTEMSYWVNRYRAGGEPIPEWMIKTIEEVLAAETDYENYPFVQFTKPGDPLILTASIVYDTAKTLHLTKRLIKAGVNVNLTDRKGLTALHASVFTLNVKAVELLLKNGADSPAEQLYLYGRPSSSRKV